jgi:hypothetical protein
MRSSVVGHLGCFQSLAVVNSAAVNTGVQVALSYAGAHSFGYTPRSGFAKSYSSCIFSFLRGFRISFHSGGTNLHSHPSI